MGLMNDLFAGLQDQQTIEQTHTCLPPRERALASLERVLLAQHPCQLSFSSGKDSSACANLLFTAAISIIARGHTCPPLYVCHADTGVENPVVRALADAELAKMRRFAEHHRLPLQIHVGRPTLSAAYAPRIIGGRALPPYPGVQRDCTQDWKIAVSQRITSAIARGAQADAPPVVTIIGTRASESQARQRNTAARKESAHQIWFSPAGEARLRQC